MATQLFVPSFRVDECLVQIKECLEKGWTGLGFKTIEFEKAWCEYTQLPHAHFLSSNTVGLHLALNVFKTKYGWNDGDEVLVTPLTFVSSNHAVLYESLQPVFVDVDDSLCMSLADVELKITDKTRAVLFVGIGGNVGQYAEIVELCQKRSIKIILDAAHMAGTRVDGKHVGHEADVVVFSYQAVKNLPTADSGMICFASADDDHYARKLAWLGINKDTYSRTTSEGAYKWKYDVEDVGFKYHGNSIMAAIALVQLKYLDLDNSYRRQLATWYAQELIDAPAVRIVEHSARCESSRHLFQVKVTNRDDLMMSLNKHQIYPGVHYRDNTHYRMYAYAAGTCPRARAASDEILSLPMHLGLNHRDICRITECLKLYAK